MRGDVSVQLEVNDLLLILVLRTNYGFNNIARSPYISGYGTGHEIIFCY